MNFEYSDDQRMLKDSVDRLIANRYQFDQRATYEWEENGWSQSVWSNFVDLGFTMLPFSEELGGLGLSGVETMILGEAFGRGLVLEPYFASIVLAGTAIAEGGGDKAAELLEPIMGGSTIAAFADLAEVSCDNGHLRGTASMVVGGDCADLFVVPVGEIAYLVPLDTPGLSVRSYKIHGGGGAADLVLGGVAIKGLGALAAGASQRAREAGIAYLAAEAAGAMQAALDITVEYLKTREQFGKAIGSNQALQHRAAEMLVEVEQAKSAAIFAAILSSETDLVERARGFAAVKAVIGKTGRFVGQYAVQLHGGIGVSEEHVVGHWFRRLTAIGMLLGSTETHIKKLAELGGFTGPEEHLLPV